MFVQSIVYWCYLRQSKDIDSVPITAIVFFVLFFNWLYYLSRLRCDIYPLVWNKKTYLVVNGWGSSNYSKTHTGTMHRVHRQKWSLGHLRYNFLSLRHPTNHTGALSSVVQSKYFVQNIYMQIHVHIWNPIKRDHNKIVLFPINQLIKFKSFGWTIKNLIFS